MMSLQVSEKKDVIDLKNSHLESLDFVCNIWNMFFSR